MSTAQSETAIMRAVLVAVSAVPGAMFWRCNVGSGVTWHGAPISYGVVGMPDIMGVYLSRAIGIEVKVPRGRSSEAQRRFRKAFTQAGGLYLVARSVTEAMEGLASV